MNKKIIAWLFSLWLFASGCFFQCTKDPLPEIQEPVAFALTNTTDQPIYLPVNEAHHPISQAVSILSEHTDILGHLDCSLLICEEACLLEACPAPNTFVRMVLPQETYSFEWEGLVYQSSSVSCNNEIPTNKKCYQVSIAKKGTYEAKLCYGKGMQATGNRSIRRVFNQTNLWQDAKIKDETCLEKTLTFHFPSNQVRYEWVVRSESK